MKKFPVTSQSGTFTGLRACKSADGVEELSAVMTLATGSAQTETLRIEEWNGREYTVVPVVAIVEGVLHGANALTPEFAAASEFGKFPRAWDGRPVVMNHPQINGVFVSAGMPEVLTDFGMGIIFNTRLDGKKLKCEAWLDHSRIEEAGGEMLETLERIRNNEVVEVSVGAWIDVLQRAGSFNGKAYQGVWSGVAPDHLAFLSKGTEGACSVKDGCGVPRLFSVNAAKIGAATSCCKGCDEGVGCSAEPSANEEIKTPAENSSNAAETILALERRSAAHEVILEELSVHAAGEKGLMVNKVPGNMAFGDIKVIVFQGLQEILNLPPYDIDLSCITVDQVVYHIWGRAGLWARSYTVKDDGSIKFSAEEEAVNLLTRIVPRQTNEPNVNQEERTDDMAGNNPGEGGGNTVETPNNTGEEAGAAEGQMTVETASPTFDQLLAAASGETRESIEYGQRMFAARKEELVKSILAVEGCKFTEEQLKAFGMDQLEGMASLANVQTFKGRAVPGDQEGISTNAEGGQSGGQKIAAAPSSYLGTKAE